MFLTHPTDTDIYNFLRSTLTFQFNEQIAQLFLEDYSIMRFEFSRKTKKLKFIYINDQIFAAYRPQVGRFSLSLHSALKIVNKIPSPKFRVCVQTDIQEFIKDGKSVFTKHVVDVDPDLQIGDEVIVVNEENELLAIGKLSLPPKYITQNVDGSCVKVRKGINSLKE